ncbi:MAG TPA: LemA family protein [Bacteroidales bacterium]|nr:MAG: LemA family protein [Bacteroidetes bacterium ADurb.Bin139]HOG24615.1 LemA family protein [Bacteroidales bacterium]HOR11217.1 LemA family protein [Bacteroidales bacterium]HOZ18905.1 LemA family protein [Bacteroidales bacterium]HPB77658.1 LemA family protein [Bacteroidales bacterium]
MKKSTIWIIIIAIIALLVMWFVRINNRMVEAQEQAVQAWAQVENVYQRRADLIPNLVNTVKGAADFEKGTLEAVIEARSRATSITVDPANLTEESMAAFQSAQDDLGKSLGRLMAVVESYPELKANQNFLELQAQLEGTENRIAVERRTFNQVVQAYNVLIRKFPNSIVAGMRNFESKAYFEATEGAETPPVVEF